MRGQLASALTLVLAGSSAFGLQSPPPPATPPVNTQPPASTVFYAGPGVTEPKLIRPDLSIVRDRNCEQRDGVVTLAGIVGADGLPSEMKTLAADSPELSNLALSLVNSEKFKPGTHDRTPVPVAVTIQLRLQTCVKRPQNSAAAEASPLTLRSQPEQVLSVRSEPQNGQPEPDLKRSASLYKVGGRVSLPVPLFQPEAEYTDVARKAGINGVCLVGLIIDTNGAPQKVHIVKAIGSGLDAKAMEAVRKYRFKPAMLDGKIPVPVEANIEVHFRLYNRH